MLCYAALGVNRGEPMTALAEGTRNIINAMQKYGVQRIVYVSAAGCLGERAGFLLGRLLLWALPRVSPKAFGAMARQYREVEKSGVQWVAIRPILLDEGPRTGSYRVPTEGIPNNGFRINTGDVAEFMLKELASEEYVRKAPALAY